MFAMGMENLILRSRNSDAGVAELRGNHFLMLGALAKLDSGAKQVLTELNPSTAQCS